MQTKNRARVTQKMFTDVQRRRCCTQWKQAQKNGMTFKKFCKNAKLAENTMRNWLRKFNMPMPAGSRAKNKMTTRRVMNTVSTAGTKNSTRRNMTAGRKAKANARNNNAMANTTKAKVKAKNSRKNKNVTRAKVQKNTRRAKAKRTAR